MEGAVMVGLLDEVRSEKFEVLEAWSLSVQKDGFLALVQFGALRGFCFLNEC